MTALAKTSRSGPRRLSFAPRFWSGVLAVALLAVLFASAWMTPSARGHSTHEQLGLVACSWVQLTGKPCPTCGMTTAFAHAAHADLLSAARTQPMGALLSLVTTAGFWIALHAAVFGSRVGSVVSGIMKPWVWWLLGAALVGSWLYKMAVWQG